MARRFALVLLVLLTGCDMSAGRRLVACRDAAGAEPNPYGALLGPAGMLAANTGEERSWNDRVNRCVDDARRMSYVGR